MYYLTYLTPIKDQIDVLSTKALFMLGSTHVEIRYKYNTVGF